LFPYFPYIGHLFEVLEPNLMGLNLSELTLTLFNSIQLNLTEFTAVNKFVAMVTMEYNPNPQFSKAHLTNMNVHNFKMIEAMGLKTTASRSL
jgi:hypothetical protein